ncbi:MAG: TetR/AcrR family transcriptional regulator [Sandaracinaceae bacterium]|nr:TetR/AcrR family transcriptional regulator [Sandaracinaceae bacterium]
MKEDGRTERASRSREQKRAHILSTAIRVFGKKGFHQTSIADIVDEAGVARGTFYLYFESKSAVFLELLDQLLLHLRQNVVGVDVGAGARPIDEQLLDTVRRILRTAENNRSLATILFREAVGLDADVDRKLREFYGSIHLFLVGSFSEGERLGLTRPLDTEATASCILGSIKQVIEQHLVVDADAVFDIDRFASAIVSYNIRGLMPHTPSN